MKTSDFLYQMGEVPINQRTIVNPVVLYHLTNKSNLDSIKQNGLIAKSTHDRQDAVYFFADVSDCNLDNSEILGLDRDFVIIKILIPAKNICQFGRYDGLYNMAFNAYSAVQYLNDIPTNWIQD